MVAVQPRRGAERVLAADRDQPIDPGGIERGPYQLRPVVPLEGIRT
jgi:hypothetical protein